MGDLTALWHCFCTSIHDDFEGWTLIPPPLQGEFSVTDGIRLTRRTGLKLAGAGAIAALATRGMEIGAMAQSASPAAGGGVLAGIGLPELTITVTDSSFEGVGGELDAGTYFVRVTNTMQESAQVVFMQLWKA